MGKRDRRIATAVRRLAKDLRIDEASPEVRLAEALAETIDLMDADERVRMLPNHAGPLLRALAELRESAPPAEGAPAPRGLSDAELAAFLAEVDAEHGSG